MKSLVLAWLMVLTLCPSFSRATTLPDHSFEEMILNTQVIGLFRVIESGSFKARLRPVEIYKGTIKGDIWLAGLRNGSTPIDSSSVGQIYILFANAGENYKGQYVLSSAFEKYGNSPRNAEAFNFVAHKPNGFICVSHYIVKKGNVFLDLAEVNKTIEGFPAEDFKRLVAHKMGNNQAAFIEHCKKQVVNNLAGNNAYLLSNYLAMLELVDGISFDERFYKVAKHSSWEAKFTLAKLLGKMKGDPSRDLLMTLLTDSSGVVQGEALRQLAKSQPVEFLGPLLIQLDSTPSAAIHWSLTSPVRSSWESGKIEIVKAFRKLKYKPATRHLIPLLRTDDRMLLNEVLGALVRIDSKREYTSVLNERLSDPEISWGTLYDILGVVEMEDLLECKDVLLRQLSTRDRNGETNKTMILYTLATLAAKDSSIHGEVLKDFDHFFTYYDTLDSSIQERMFTEYIKTFTTLESEKARPLIYRTMYEWTGLKPDVHNSVEAFQKKRAKEDSLKSIFSTSAVLKKYKSEDVLYFGLTKPRFIVSVTLPDNNAPKERQKLIADALQLPERDLYFVGKDDVYFYDRQNRFDKNFNRIIKTYCKYAEALPHKTDLVFLKALMASDRWEGKQFERELSAAVEVIEAALVK